MSRLRDLVYQHAPYPVQNLLISAYGRYLKSIRYGSAYRQCLATIEGTHGLTAEEVAVLQARRLDSFVREAIRHVRYYGARYADVLEHAGAITPQTLRDRFSILEKRDVKDHQDAFVSQVALARDCTTVFTSGTTGSPLEVVASKASVAQNFAFFSSFLREHGLDPFAWSATFAGRLIVPKSQVAPPFWRCNRAMRTWLFSSYHIGLATIPAYLRQLEKVEPTYIDSYPSSIYAIARYVVDRKVRHSIRPVAVVTSSEVLTARQREVIEEAFKCPVFDQYGSAEMVVFAAQCRSGSYHVHPLYGVTEVVNERGEECAPGEPGELVATGLLNAAMPLIRYRIGDRASLRTTPCPCGNTFPALSEVLGREDDYIVTPEGHLVGRLDPLFKGLKGIGEAQIVQESVERIDVVVVPGEGFDERAKAILIGSLRERLGERIGIQVHTVDAIPRTANGKFRSVISKLKGASMR